MQKEISFRSDLQQKSKSKTGFLNSGRMGELIYAKDWSQTSLGPVENWPQPLCAALDICLKSKSPIGICWGEDLRLLYNDAWSEMAGGEHLLGQTARQVFEDDWQLISPCLKNVFLSGEAVQLQHQHLSLNGKEGWFDLSLSPLSTEDGLGGIFCIASETTGQIQAEKRCKDIEKVLQIETVGVAFFDYEGKITDANEGFLRMSGFSRKDLDTGNLRWDAITPSEWMPTTQRAIKELRETGATTPYEKEYYRKDGSRWWALFSAKYLGDGKSVEFVLDITGRKKIEEQLKAMNETLEDRVEERTASLLSYQKQLRSLAARLSKAEEHVRQQLAAELHDNLGQILAVGKMKVDLLQKARLTDSLATDVEEVKKLVEEALTYTRILMSDLKPPPSLDKEDVRATINWLAEKMKKHDLCVTVDDDGKPKKAREEIRTTLLQCVRELLFNVVKHSGVNEARIEMSQSNQQIQIIVEDRGKGFDLEAKKPTPTDQGGFGLFNIYERMDLIEGSMHIASTPAKGTKIKLLAPVKVDSKRDRKGGGDKSAGKPGPTGSLQKVKVLLVDDHQMMRKGLRTIVDEQDDLTVVGEASNGKEAVKLVDETDPDIVVMDVNMPVMNGIEATQEIMSNEPALRIIGLSLHDHKNVIESMLEAGASAYLSKNEAFETLCATIRSEATLTKG